jgi:hypothetical protein
MITRFIYTYLASNSLLYCNTYTQEIDNNPFDINPKSTSRQSNYYCFQLCESKKTAMSLYALINMFGHAPVRDHRRIVRMASSGSKRSSNPQARRMQRLRQQGSGRKTQSLEERLAEQRHRERETDDLSRNREVLDKGEVLPATAPRADPTLQQQEAVIATDPPHPEVAQVEAEVDTVPLSPDQRPMSAAERQAREAVQRKAAVLMEIMQAGADVESAIERNLHELDETVLDLLRRRLDAARQLERSQDVADGLKLLYRRLKAEIDRKAASPAMRLLDTLLGIYEEASILEQQGSESNGGGGLKSVGGGGSSGVSPTEVRSQVRAQLSASFRGYAPQEDVLSLAAQLAKKGSEVAERLLDEQVEPRVFVNEVMELVRGAGEQQRQLEKALRELPERSPERDRIQAVANERAVALAHVEEVLQLARELAA